MRTRFAVLFAVPLLLVSAAQRRGRVHDDSTRADVAAAVAREFDSYRKQVKAPNGETIDLTPTLRRIADGKSLRDVGLPPHDGDGTVFLNLVDRAAGRRPLPPKPRDYYVEFVVPPNDHARWPGPQRLIVGRNGEAYYSPNHYDAEGIVPLNER